MTSLGAVHGIVFASLSVVATSMHVQHKPALSMPRISLRVDGPGDDAPRSSDDAEACGLLARELGASVLLPTLQRTAATVLSRVLADDAMRESLAAVSLTARVKSPVSLLCKLRRQGLSRGASAAEIARAARGLKDAAAMRLVLTPRAGDEALGEDEVCYRGFELALGPRRGRASEDDPRLAVASDGTTKDYLARPKANGYASLHADLLAKACPAAQRAGAWRAGAPDVPVELQIRSARMDAVAERGAANHATYKAAQRRRLAEAGWARYDDVALAAV